MRESKFLALDMLIATSLRLANENLASAILLMDNDLRTAPTMAAQSLEHILLALCHSEAIHISRSEQHQLDAICRRLPDENPYKTLCRKVSWLEGYSTSYRYPKTKGGLSDEPEDDDLQAAIVAIKGILDAVAKHFGVTISSTSQVSARNTNPPRSH
jgi:HEPN domain